jgi:DNA end-binding protein Ku
VRIQPQELKMSASLVESFESDFEPEKFTDDYQVQLRELIDAKLKEGDSLDTDATFGETDDEKEDGGGEVLDLMEALRRSVEKSRGGKATGGKGSATKSSAKTPSQKSAAKKPAATKKAAPKKTASSSKASSSKTQARKPKKSA